MANINLVIDPSEFIKVPWTVGYLTESSYLLT